MDWPSVGVTIFADSGENRYVKVGTKSKVRFAA